MVEKKAQKKEEKKKAAHDHKKPEVKEKKSPTRAVAQVDEDDFDECEARYLECKKCGLLVSVEEECRCEDCTIMCCGEPMVELVPSMEGDEYSCSKCGIKIIVEEDCGCDARCDLVCCNQAMVLIED